MSSETGSKDRSHSKVDEDDKGPTIPQLLQLRAMYELTTSITDKCFETCLTRLNPRLEESDKNCISNCAANFLHMKLLFTQRLVDAAKLAPSQ